MPIVVFGAAPGATGPSSGIIGAETAVQAAVAALVDPLAAFVPVSTDPLGAWITGTGKVGATTATGNSDYLTDTDGVHPVDAEGVAHLGRRYAAGALAALTTMARNV